MNEVGLSIIGCLDLLLVMGVVMVAVELSRKRINGVCQVTLASLGVWRAWSVGGLVAGGSAPCGAGTWLADVMFGYFVLYMAVHLANLVTEARKRGSEYAREHNRRLQADRTSMRQRAVMRAVRR